MALRAAWVMAALLPAWSISLTAACAGPASMRQAASYTDSVFVGRVLSIAPDKQPVYEMGVYNEAKLRVHFEVLERFPLLDSPGGEADVFTAAHSYPFGFPFRVGNTYLVLANRRGKALLTSQCQGTKLLRDAGEDLSYLRSLSRIKQTGEVNGFVVGGHPSADGFTWAPPWVYTFVQWLLPPDLERHLLRGMPIRLEGNGVSRFAVTDGGGGFHFWNVPPGFYMLRLEQNDLIPSFNHTIHVLPGASEPLWIYAQVPRTIEGTVTTASGGVAPDVLLELARSSGKELYSQSFAQSDENGHFRIETAFPGDYYLGVSIGAPPSRRNPYGTWCYPGTTALEHATLFRFGREPQARQVSFKLPPPLPSDVMKVQIFMQNGQLDQNAELYIKDTQAGSGMNLRCCTTAGTIAFRAFESRSYRMVAFDSKLADPIWMTQPLTLHFTAATPRTLKLFLSQDSTRTFQKTEEWIFDVH